MTRTERRHEVERLLGRIFDGVVDLERMRLHGVRGRPIAEREREVAAARKRLADVVSRR